MGSLDKRDSSMVVRRYLSTSDERHFSNARTSREQPIWIYDDNLKIMGANWETEEAKKRSKTYSKARMADRNGLGPHIHLSGSKSYQQLHNEMVSISIFPLHLCKSDICSNHFTCYETL